MNARKSIKIDPELHRELKKISVSEGLRIDHMIDDACREYLRIAAGKVAAFNRRLGRLKVKRSPNEE
jgi:hypothetical protein